MTRETHGSGYDDVEELRKRFEEFRSEHRPRTRMLEELWRVSGGDSEAARSESGLPVFGAVCEQCEQVDGRARHSDGAEGAKRNRTAMAPASSSWNC